MTEGFSILRHAKRSLLHFTSGAALLLASVGGAITTPLLFSGSAHATDFTVCDVACDADSIQTVINNAVAGDTINFGGNASIGYQLTIDRPLTINGNGFTVSPTFTKTDNSNNSVFGVQGTNNVTITNINIDGSAGSQLHGINVYVSTSVVISNTSVMGVAGEDRIRSGILVNGSTVSVNNVFTSGSFWHGINVDQGSGVMTPATLSIDGPYTSTDQYPIYLDDPVNPDITVADSTGQYTEVAPGVYVAAAIADVQASFTATANYKGIDVDISTNYLTDATSVEVKVDRAAGGAVTKTSKAPVLAILNTGAFGASVTAPIVIQSGTYDEAADPNWNKPTSTWDHTTTPTQITVTIYRPGGNLVMVKTLAEVDTSAASLADVMPAAPVTPPAGGGSGSGVGSTPVAPTTTTTPSPVANTGAGSSDETFIAALIDGEATEDDGEVLGQSKQTGTSSANTSADNDEDEAEGCGELLGTCWYFSVPAAAVILGAGAYFFYTRRLK